MFFAPTKPLSNSALVACSLRLQESVANAVVNEAQQQVRNTALHLPLVRHCRATQTGGGCMCRTPRFDEFRFCLSVGHLSLPIDSIGLLRSPLLPLLDMHDNVADTILFVSLGDQCLHAATRSNACQGKSNAITMTSGNEASSLLCAVMRTS